MALGTAQVVVGTSVALSFTLFGNAITQSFMGVPAVLVDFPLPPAPSPPSSSSSSPSSSSPDNEEKLARQERKQRHAARARLLGRQWPVFWVVGNRFFRPISTLGILGYGYGAFAAYYQRQFDYSFGAGVEVGSGNWNWKILAAASLCHLVTVVHSAVNMQPLNEKIEGLARAVEREQLLEGVEGKEGEEKVDVRLAEDYARTWIKYNTVRLVTPVVAGTLALWQLLGSA